MAELKMEIILAAVDRVTTMLRGIDGSIGKTKKNLTDYKKRVRELHAGIPLSGPLTKQQQRDQKELERTTRMIEQQQKRLKDLYKMQSHRNSGKAMMGAGSMQIAAATAMGYGVSRLMQEGIEFEATMSRVQALTKLQKNDPMLLKLQQQSEYLGESTWATAKQAAEGQAFYAMAGFKPQDILNAMPSTLDIAKAGSLEIGRAADISSNILSAFKLPADQLGKVADSLVATFTRTNTDMEMLGQTMKYVAPVANSLGMSLEESLAMAGLLGNIGIQSDQAGTSLRKIEQRLSAPPSGAAKALKALGVTTKDEKGNLRNVAVIFQELFEKTKDFGSADRMKYLTAISGLEASAAMTEFTSGDFYNKYIGLLKEVEEAHAKGEAAYTAGTMSDNVAGEIERLSSAWSGFKMSIFQTNSKGLRTSLEYLTKIMGAINAFSRQNPDVIRNLSYITAGVIGITASLGLAKLAWGAFQFAVLGNPIVASIAAIGLAAYAVYKNFDQWVWLWREGFGFMQWEVENFLRRIPVVGNHLGNIWKVMTEGLSGIKTIFQGIYDLFFDTENLMNKLGPHIDDLIANVKYFWDDMKANAQIAIDEIMKILQPFLDAYNHLIGKKPEFTASQKLIHDYNTNPKAFNSHYLNKFKDLNEKVLGLDKIVSQDEYLKAMQRGESDEIKAKVLEFQRNALEVKNQTQTNTFQIHITAPDGNASNIADAVKRGIASVTQGSSPFLGDLK